MVPRNMQDEYKAPMELWPLPLELLKKQEKSVPHARRNLYEQLGNEPRSGETAGVNQGVTCKKVSRCLGRCPVPVLGSVPSLLT